MKNSFVKGALILGISGIIVKILGAFFRIPLGNIITSEGMGYYQAAYPMYVLLLAISSSGFPTAISKLVSENIAKNDYKGANDIFRVSFVMLIITGIVSSCLLYFGADIISHSMKNPKAYYSMRAIAPALLFVPIMAAFRGYFQGRQQMTPTAVSQVIEQGARVILGLALAMLLIPKGNEIAAAGASFGAAAGAIFGSLFMIFIYFRNRKIIKSEINTNTYHEKLSIRQIVNKILVIAIPITIGSSVMPIMNMIDATVVMGRLQSSGYSYKEATMLYGQLTGMAATLINLPQVLTMAIATSLVPVISDAFARNNIIQAKQDIKGSIKIAILIGLPAAFGLASLATPIMQMLYPHEGGEIGQILLYLSMGVIFLSLTQTLTGILQGMSKPYIPVINLIIGAICKLIITYILTANPVFNVKGAAIGTVCAYMVSSFLNIGYLRKTLKIKFEMKEFVVKPMFATLTMSVACILIYHLMIKFVSNAIATCTAIFIACVLYGVLIVVFRCVSENEILNMPKGNKLVKLLKKINLL